MAESKHHQIPKSLLRRSLEIVLIGSLRNRKLSSSAKAKEVVRKLSEVMGIIGSDERPLPIVVEMALNHVRRGMSLVPCKLSVSYRISQRMTPSIELLSLNSWKTGEGSAPVQLFRSVHLRFPVS